VKDAVRRCPRESGYHASVWTTKLVRHFIYTRFGREYCRERVRQLLHALGFRLRRLRHRHLKAKAEEQAVFQSELQALLEEWPEEWELIFVDEATLRRHPTLTAQWCLVDDVPEVPTGDDHTKVQVYGAGAPLTGRTHYHVSSELGRTEFAQFLQHLLTYYPGKRLLVIHDRAGQHQGAPVEATVREAGSRLILKPQPAYSPELNPQERIWTWLRRVVTHHHWFATLREQVEAMRNFFRYLAGIKEQVQRLCGLKTPASFVASLYGAKPYRLVIAGEGERRWATMLVSSFR
jgi:DDE superfamily endonuclease/Winged helix-turn helix